MARALISIEKNVDNNKLVKAWKDSGLAGLNAESFTLDEFMFFFKYLNVFAANDEAYLDRFNVGRIVLKHPEGSKYFKIGEGITVKESPVTKPKPHEARKFEPPVANVPLKQPGIAPGVHPTPVTTKPVPVVTKPVVATNQAPMTKPIPVVNPALGFSRSVAPVETEDEIDLLKSHPPSSPTKPTPTAVTPTRPPITPNRDLKPAPQVPIKPAQPTPVALVQPAPVTPVHHEAQLPPKRSSTPTPPSEISKRTVRDASTAPTTAPFPVSAHDFTFANPSFEDISEADFKKLVSLVEKINVPRYSYALLTPLIKTFHLARAESLFSKFLAPREFLLTKESFTAYIWMLSCMKHFKHSELTMLPLNWFKYIAFKESPTVPSLHPVNNSLDVSGRLSF